MLLEQMGLTSADLAAAPQHRREVPTFAQYVPVVSAAVSAGTRRAYGSYWSRVVEHRGGRRLDEPTPSEIRQLMAYVKTHVVARRTRLEDLDYGDIDGICAAARVYPLTGVKKDELDTALGYFENNAPRMRYKWFRSRGLFVGSGAVESGCKAVIGQRLKLSGMHWTVAGASAITTLRCQQASRPDDQIWRPARNQTPAA